MKKAIIILMLFANHFPIICLGDQPISTIHPELTIKPINKKLELFNAIKNAISGIVAGAACCYSIKAAKDCFLESESHGQTTFFLGLDIFIALTLLDLSYVKLVEALASLKRYRLNQDACPQSCFTSNTTSSSR
jgi:hypothetical protein